MKCLFALLAVATLALCGCVERSRTPYNEIALFAGEEAAEGRETLNLWPLYLSDGRARYVAWPLIKSSPGCFAFLPFYNYDHGIHDFCLLATAVPEDGVYRFLPFFYRDPKRWFIPPLAYGSGESWGVPLLFNHIESEYGPNFTNVLNLVFLEDGWVLFPFVWWRDDGDDFIKGVLPFWLCSYDTLPRSFILWTPLSFFSLGRDYSRVHFGPLGLPFYATIETPKRTFTRRLLVSHDRHWATAKDKPDGPPVDNEWGVAFGFLWRWRERSSCNLPLPPDEIHGRVKRGVEWSFLFGLLAHGDLTEYVRFAEGKRASPGLGAALDELVFHSDETLPPIPDTLSDAWFFRKTRTRSASFGWFLWRDMREDNFWADHATHWRIWFTPLLSRSHLVTVDGKGAVTETKAETGLLFDAFSWRTVDGAYDALNLLGGVLLHAAPDRLTLLGGLLYEGSPSPTRLLCGLLYKRADKEDGSLNASALCGFLYDRAYVAKTGEETFGILGWLYRSSRAADGTRERFALPGLSLTTHEDSDDWAFSFLGGLLGFERTADETDWRLLWFF